MVLASVLVCVIIRGFLTCCTLKCLQRGRRFFCTAQFCSLNAVLFNTSACESVQHHLYDWVKARSSDGLDWICLFLLR